MNSSLLLKRLDNGGLLPAPGSDLSFTGSRMFNYDFGYMVNKSTYKYTTKFELITPILREYNHTVKCNKKTCKCCEQIDNSRVIYSNSNGNKFCNRINHEKFDCSTSNVIYLIHCAKCNLQYVGQTKRKLRERLGRHRQNAADRNHNNFLYSHFRSTGHSIKDMRVKVLEKCSNIQDLNMAEDFWIKTLQTIFPLGLNDNIRGIGNVSQLIGCKDLRFLAYYYNTLPRKHRGNGRRRRVSKNLNMQFVEFFKTCNLDDGTFRNLLKEVLKQSNKTIKIAICNLDRYDKFYEHKMTLLNCFLERKSFREHNCTINSINKEYFVTDYPGKGFGHLNYGRILNNKKFLRLLPEICSNIKIITAFTYDTPLGVQLFNYNKTLKSVLGLQNLQDINEFKCKCLTSEFTYKPAQHIVTCNCLLFDDQPTRNYLQKGTKYRPIFNKSRSKIKDNFQNSVQVLIERLQRKYGGQRKAYDHWITEITNKFNWVIDIIKLNEEYKTDNNILNFKKRFFDNTKHFVVCPVDKASNNYCFICKKYYFEVLCKELGVNVNDQSVVGNDVYKPCYDTLSCIFNKHEQLCDRFHIGKNFFDRYLPIIYAIPKLHKNPYKFRFIAGAKKSSIKPLTLSMHVILQHFKYLFRKYNLTYSTANCGRGAYFSVDGTKDLMKYLHDIRYKCSTVCTADFTTLFTNLPHNDIYTAVRYLFQMIFNHSKKLFLVVKNDRIRFSDTHISGNNVQCYTLAELSYLLHCVIHETYVTFAGTIFKQVKGVPMGGNASPDLADLTLSIMEYRNNIIQRPVYMFRYVDDLLMFNCTDFSTLINNLYVNTLNVEKTKEGIDADFLDLNIRILDNCLVFKIYNKTDKFNFPVLKSIDKYSNVEDKIHLGVLFTQILRFLRICTNFEDFVVLSKNFINNYFERGFDKTLVYKHLIKFLYKKRLEFDKFGFQLNFRFYITRLLERLFNNWLSF